MARIREEDWIILQTSSAATIGLAQSLAEVGYDVWTPIEMRQRLVGAKREEIEQEVAIIPGYVFARYDRMADLLQLSRSPSLNYRVWDAGKRSMVTKGHPYFSLFRMHGHIRGQSERGLAPLRALEESLARLSERRRERALRKGPAPRFVAGTLVRVGGGGFEGLRLLVAEDSVGKTVKLVHPDWSWPVEISAWKLHEIQVQSEQPEPAVALAA